MGIRGCLVFASKRIIAGRALALPARDHQAGPDDDKNYAGDWWNLPIVVGGDAYMRVAYAEAVMFGMRKRNEERHYSKD